jgi:hypothetical protein
MSKVGRFIFKLLTLAAMLLGLPLLGITLAGHPLQRYFEFPPVSRYVVPAAFSRWAFTAYAVFIGGTLAVLLVQAYRGMRASSPAPAGGQRFPWWGWLGAATGLAAWVMAWTRQDWFAPFQAHTFTPLWLSYILVVNAVSWYRSGRCMMLDRPVYFLCLFPVSAVFWWFFEYLNRYVQNWYYPGVYFGPWEYFGYATLCFSTVLPAVLGTRDAVASAAWLQNGFKEFVPIRIPRPRWAAGGILVLASAGLTGIGIWPNLLFPLVWISPLLIIVSFQVLMREDHLFCDLARGDWRPLVSSAVAALICGFFWEMWNYYSLAKWKYSVPFVHRYTLFEMPVLGYGGYLPFGPMCAVVGSMLEKVIPGGRQPAPVRSRPVDTPGESEPTHGLC